MNDDTRSLMAELQEVAREGLRPEHELTISARAKGWDIFSPDWEFLLEHPALPILSLCALSVGLHPHFADPAWVLHVAIPAVAPGGEAGGEGIEAETKLRLFLRRSSVASSHARHGTLSVLPAPSADGLPEASTSEFADWAGGLGWALPGQFQAPGGYTARTDVRPLTAPHPGDCAPAGRWPWGDHHTELLGHLEAAAEKFWRYYDPADETTAPTSSDVEKWLKARGLSENKAKAITLLLRPDGLRTGPRR